MNWYLKVLTNYANFEGRARRKEYWMFVLVNFCLGFTAGFLSGLFQAKQILGVFDLYQLGVLIPSLAVGVRRMHDTNHSGWWILCPIYNFVLLCQEGDAGPNEHGPDPKGDEPRTEEVARDPQAAAFSPPPVRVGNAAGTIAQLAKLAELKKAGHLTEEEFAAQKKQLLAG